MCVNMGDAFSGKFYPPPLLPCSFVREKPVRESRTLDGLKDTACLWQNCKCLHTKNIYNFFVLKFPLAFIVGKKKKKKKKLRAFVEKKIGKI